MFGYSIIALIIISIKKKDAANVSDVKKFQKNVFLVFLVLLACLLVLSCAVIFPSISFIFLLLLLVFLIAVPVFLSKKYRHQEKKKERDILAELFRDEQE